MSFGIDVLSNAEQPSESDRSHPTTNGVVTAGDAQQDVNEEEVMDDVEEEIQSDGEDDE
ncbi:uncharacterized protein LAESUDRAFT_754110 [Laetiporus sulphureus 93-53]|uniref:Uncharacterized protein n=1 Tax=Laetiporus sulphureus 93-53 TaxID=1314785 RepID=A0A165IHY7_9APHY|nr:uncharacterized protein LAESUDRAFT_754110 [Laetiporus sulphureus 93-53]KZT13099.1 hypothetical protein LAESUDRAFT_754110 [Laetiporus sulphureus 93-53]